ncbi:MAG: stage III sporulation protein AB [Angelakisella sp.]|nr:stage III sporulation protein AB [Angelakisella sp.]
MLKTIGLLLLFAVCVSTGFLKADELKTKTQTLYQCLIFLKQLSIQLQTRQMPPGQIIQLLCSQTAFEKNCLVQSLACHFKNSASFARNMRLTVADCPELKACGAEEVLLGLGDIIGSRSLEEQLSAIDSAQQLIEQYLSLAEEVLHNEGMLYRRMGILTGLMVIVLFL